MDITIKEGFLVYNLFDKRDVFPFYIVRVHDLSGNIPEHVFYDSISEFFRIALATLPYEDFLAKSSDLTSRMLKQGSLCVKKTINRHLSAFSSFDTNSFSLCQDCFPNQLF